MKLVNNNNIIKEKETQDSGPQTFWHQRPVSIFQGRQFSTDNMAMNIYGFVDTQEHLLCVNPKKRNYRIKGVCILC